MKCLIVILVCLLFVTITAKKMKQIVRTNNYPVEPMDVNSYKTPLDIQENYQMPTVEHPNHNLVEQHFKSEKILVAGSSCKLSYFLLVSLL